MSINAQQWASYVPLLIFALVMLWRFRSLNHARRLRVATLWVMPVIVLAAVGTALYGMHPALAGWLAFAGGMLVGSGLGVQRGRLMRLHVEGEGAEARVMVRQSMGALLLILGVFALRRLLLPGFGGGAAAGDSTGNGLLVTDAMLGFAVGLICVQRGVLWLRARRLVAEHRRL